MNSKRFATVFPLGSHLCREPMPPMAELKKDMRNLKRHGFNLIKLQEHWGVDEPVEGHYDFSRYEELIAYAACLDMGVYVGLTCEQAPHWLWRKHPDCRMVGQNGVPIAYEALTTLPADGKPGPCYDHPGALADQARFIRKLVQTLGVHENVVVWNTWQEVGYWSEGLVGQKVCFCQNTLKHFREWLKEKYGDLDRLNLAWNTRYLEWETVSPNRQHSGASCLAQDVNWKFFMTNVQLPRVLRSRADAIRAADPLKRPVFAHRGAPTLGSGEDWTYARCQDFLGSSCYPCWGPTQGWDDGSGSPRMDKKQALLAEAWDSIALRFDYIRSANRAGAPIWAAEFQGGPVQTGFHKGRVPGADDIRRWMLTAVGSGVTAISFWVTRAEIMALEVNGFSLLDSAGDTTPRFEEAARIGRALNKYPALFGKPTSPRAEIAILVNELNYRFCETLLQGGEHLQYSLRGWHRILWDAGIPVDFVEVSQLRENWVGRYKALILPFPISLSEEVAVNLAAYVQGGGNLISDACPGRIDENCFSPRGELSPAMRKLFGVRQESFAMVREPEDGKRWSPRERTWGEYREAAMLAGAGPLRGCRLRANVYIETFSCRGSRPCLLADGAIAGVVRKAGKGRAWLLGTFAGHNGTAYRDDETRACLLRLFRQCGVAPGHAGKLLIRKRVARNQEAWLLTNPTADDVTEDIAVKGRKKITDPLGGKVQRKGGRVTVTVKGLDVRLLILR